MDDPLDPFGDVGRAPAVARRALLSRLEEELLHQVENGQAKPDGRQFYLDRTSGGPVPLQRWIGYPSCSSTPDRGSGRTLRDGSMPA